MNERTIYEAGKAAYVIINAETVRCVEFLDNGQQLACWVPAGTWQAVATEKIKISSFGKVEEVEAVRLERGERVVYASPIVLKAKCNFKGPE